MATSRKSEPTPDLLTFLSAEPPANHFQSPESVSGWMIRAATSPSNISLWLAACAPAGLSGKMSPVSFPLEAAMSLPKRTKKTQGGGLDSADFATFLSFVRECGYGFAYRVLDAQYVRVDSYARAVPQRRRRVFVVGYLGDWRRAAAVLLEPQGMRGDSAPRREPGKRAAPTIASRPTGGGGLGTDFDLDGGLIPQAFGGNNQSGPINVATAVNAHGGPMGRMDFESETFVAHPLLGKANSSHDESLETYIAFDCKASGQAGFGVGEIAPTLRAMGHAKGNQNAGGQITVAHTLKGEGFDASEDGTGRGTPIIPVPPYNLAIRGRGDSHQLEYRQDGTANAVLTPNGGRAGIGVGAIAFAQNTRDEARLFGGDGQIVGALAAEPGMKQTTYVAQEWAVRRLTPTECERLQGFPDNFTNVPWRGKDHAPDGPRYKAIGNSMAVNAMRWIGARIDLMEKLIASGRIAP